MNKIRKILLSILSIPMILSSSVARATTSIEAIHNGQKVDFDEQKMEEAKNLLNRVNEKFESTNAKLGKVENDLKSYDISVNEASAYKIVIEVLKKHNTLNCRSIEFINMWVGTYLGNSEVDFVINKIHNENIITDYIQDIKELKSLEDKFNILSYEEQEKKTDEKNKIEQKKGQMMTKYGRCSTSDDPNCMNQSMVAAKLAIKNGLSVNDVLISCRCLHRETHAGTVLAKLSSILKYHFNYDSNMCASVLLPLLDVAIRLKNENGRYGKALKDRNLQYWYDDQWGLMKRLGNFISFADTSERGKANRAIDNYIEELKEALGEGSSSSSNVGTYLFLGTIFIGGSLYCLYESSDGEIKLMPKKYTKTYEQEYEDYYDDYE